MDEQLLRRTINSLYEQVYASNLRRGELFMTMIHLIAIAAFALGFAGVWLLRLALRRGRLNTAQQEADDIIAHAKANADEINSEKKMVVEDFKDVATKNFESEADQIQERIDEIKERISEQQSQFDHKLNKKHNVFNKQKKSLAEIEKKVNASRKRMRLRKEVEQTLTEDYVRQLESKSESSQDKVLEDWKGLLEEEARQLAAKISQNIVGEAELDAERMAKKLCAIALNRFARPYCAERGIGYLNPPNEAVRDRLRGENEVTLRLIEKSCGVDLAYDEKNNVFNVYGFDPVRRELGRATVEKLMKEKHIDEKTIDRVKSRCKKELFKKIRRDGNRIAKELKVHDLSEEIRDMMGALRYRYSFTQNQYFHCAEVGYMAGLLASELGIDMRDSRRSGLLHDIGKAMDHSIEGGHAVIGADFIETHGEKEAVVHAVRAHHFDVMPSTDLCYVVIAADAMSGARPGARRSTAATYTQKMHELYEIASSFDGVVDAHVLSAGREVRVMVDGRRLDDVKSLDLSKSIAEKIETDMAFPGQIKVTVVRETQSVEMAK